ncbi:MAG: PAS domain-containing protein [Rhodobiaceae bacterium]|nr:PAS domain-containing protein [Rhodobiaceae bacterium]MCC0055292.1 PAS domain-containing protein [Rhodobiaceae bacterium]
MAEKPSVTGKERFFQPEEIIVSKTDLKGRLTYANRTFIDLSGYTESECLGQQHNLIRHPDMPRAIFNLLWETIQDGREIFAYVVNRSKNGDHYWVYAHVTPSRDMDGNIVGYHSNRRVPDRDILNNHILPLYERLLRIERDPANRKEGLAASRAELQRVLDEAGKKYDEFIMTVGQGKRRGYRDAGPRNAAA